MSKSDDFMTVKDQGQSKPAINTEVPRLYGHLLCAFATKVRLALAAKAVKYERCEVDLSKKTQWHIDINGGKVPILELTDGTTICESKVIMDYLEDAYPESGYSLLHPDPVKRAFMRIASTSLIDGFNMAWFKIFMKKVYDEADFKAFYVQMQKIEDFIKENGKEGSPFAQGTDNPTQLDIHLFTTIYFIYLLKGSVYHEFIWNNVKFDQYPLILKLLFAIRDRPEFASNCVIPSEKPLHEYCAKHAQEPAGVFVQLFLPWSNE